ncbi:MAG TPA: PEP/pyruvate-binding domain-containing protein [Anaerolineales bacterium]|nr:PEP/pyruvate-binding domain-containing protein [Anaerolineales bacterium]
MAEYILTLADTRSELETTGGKGASLARLIQAGLPVPTGFHITTAAYWEFVRYNQLQEEIQAALQAVDLASPATLEEASLKIKRMFSNAQIPPVLANAIVQAYASLPGSNPAVAVRSSATAEDLPEASFAGQQETYLNVSGAAEVLEATQKCWASLWTGRAISYRARQNIASEGVALAVVVQLLVPAEAAGIMFTANPISGERSQAVISAAWGLGEAVVGGAVTPDMLTVEKESSKILQEEIAEKETMTVRVNGGTQEKPVPQNLRLVPVLSEEIATDLVQLGIQIESLFGTPMDIEWALYDGKLSILQARPITALPEPQAATPNEWALPKPKGQYMRGSLVDLMPNPVSPLFISMGMPAIADMGITRVMRVLTRSEPALPRDYITTINSYAYMCGAFNRSEWWWILTRMLPSFMRLMREGFTLWRDDVRPRYAQMAAIKKAMPIEEMKIAELWGNITELVNMMGEYIASILVATTGASAGTEMLFSRVYDKLVKREGDPEATTFLLGYNNIPIRAEKSLYDLAEWARDHLELTDLILNVDAAELTRLLVADSSPKGVSQEIWKECQDRLRLHLDQFGHVIYEVDFAKQLPLDDPTPMLQACKMYLRGEGGNPYERQKKLETRRLQATEAVLQRTKGFRRWAFTKSLGLAQSRAEVREDAIADIGLGYPALRKAFNELGDRLVRASAIEEAQDIYYLNKSEVEAMLSALESNSPLASMAGTVRERRAALAAAQRLNPPPMLPPKKKYMGIDMSHFVPMTEGEQTAEVLKGVGASAGRVTATACVLASPADFDRMQPGDVIVAPITTPAWTPLFAMASAVVTDIGGPLSHGSIVAREYGIPAVLGTGIASRHIRNGQRITVDGNAGTVTLDGDHS